MSVVDDFLTKATDVVGPAIEQTVGVAAPAIGAVVGGPAGAAAGSAFGNLAKGGDLNSAALSAGTSYAGNALAGGGGEFVGGGESGGAVGGGTMVDGSGAPVDFSGGFSGGIPNLVGGAAGGEAGGPSGGGTMVDATGAPVALGGGAPAPAVPSFGGDGTAPLSFVGGGESSGGPTGGGSFSGEAGPGGSGGPAGGGTFSGEGGGGGGLDDAAEEARRRAAAAPAAGAPAPAGGDPGIMAKLLAGFKKNPLPYAAGAANLIAQMRASKSAGSTANQLKTLGQPAADASASLMEQYKSGKLNVGTQFDIDKWKNQQVAAARNFYAKAGMSSSSTARNAIAQIEAQAAAMADRAREGLLAQGLNAAGIAQGPLSMAIQQQAKDDTALSEAAAKALNALMVAQTMGGKPAAAPAAATA